MRARFFPARYKKKRARTACAESYNFIGQEGECDVPGSYQDRCKITSKHYHSTDKKLAKTLMCEFDVDCETLAGKIQKINFYLQSSLRYCLTFFENCDGSLVARANNEQLCKAYDVAKDQASKYKVKF